MPKATKAIALTVSLRKMKHPKWEATSPITAVIIPMVKMETVKVIYPPCKPNRVEQVTNSSHLCNGLFYLVDQLIDDTALEQSHTFVMP